MTEVENGFFREYYENGNLKSESFMKDASGEGLLIEYNEKGDILNKIFRTEKQVYIFKIEE